MLTLQEASVVAGVTRQTIYNWIREGLLPAQKPPYRKRGWHVSESDLKRVIEGRTVPSIPVEVPHATSR